MQCQNCNTEEMIKGTVPVARQKGKLTILVHQIPALVCPSCESYVLDEPIEERVAEIIEETYRTSTKSVEVALYRYAEKEEWEDELPTEKDNDPYYKPPI